MITHALTVHHPWAELIALGEKQCENRTWIPPAKLLGERIAIHSSRSYDGDADQSILRRFDGKRLDYGHIIATVRIVGVASDVVWMPANKRQYWRGPFGWALAGVERLVKPIPVSGRQRLWRLPSEAAQRLSHAETFTPSMGVAVGCL